MKLRIVIRKALIALLVASMLVVPALAMSAEAQLYGSQYSQFGTGLYGQQYPYSGGIYGQQTYGQPTGLLPPTRCPAGYYYDSYSRQCVPMQQPYPYDGPCPAGYLYDRFRQQCVPYMTV